MSQGTFDLDLVFTAAAVIVKSPVSGMFFIRCAQMFKIN